MTDTHTHSSTHISTAIETICSMQTAIDYLHVTACLHISLFIYKCIKAEGSKPDQTTVKAYCDLRQEQDGCIKGAAYEAIEWDAAG